MSNTLLTSACCIVCMLLLSCKASNIHSNIYRQHLQGLSVDLPSSWKIISSSTEVGAFTDGIDTLVYNIKPELINTHQLKNRNIGGHKAILMTPKLYHGTTGIFINITNDPNTQVYCGFTMIGINIKDKKTVEKIMHSLSFVKDIESAFYPIY